MNLNNFTLHSFSDAANKQFSDMQDRLTKLSSSFQTRMEGKTTAGLVGAIIGTVAWLVAAIVGCSAIRSRVDGTLLLVGIIAVVGLFGSMLIDEIMSFSHYGRIASYGNAVSQLQNRVAIGKDSIRANHDAFMKTQSSGWEYPLHAAASIPEEATSIESTLNTMEALKAGFIHGAKNVFYYIAAVVITVVGCVALFETGESIMGVSDDTAMVLSVIATIIVTIGEIIFAKFIWGHTDCAVSNLTIFALIAGPLAYLALIGIGTLLVYLVVGIFQIFLYILGICLVGGIVFGSISGG